MLMLVVARNDVCSEENKIDISPLWLKLLALSGEYAKAFEEAMQEFATRSIAKDVFSDMIRSFNPFLYVCLFSTYGDD